MNKTKTSETFLPRKARRNNVVQYAAAGDGMEKKVVGGAGLCGREETPFSRMIVPIFHQVGRIRFGQEPVMKEGTP